MRSTHASRSYISATLCHGDMQARARNFGPRNDLQASVLEPNHDKVSQRAKGKDCNALHGWNTGRSGRSLRKITKAYLRLKNGMLTVATL